MICIKSSNIVKLFNKVSSTCLKLTAPNVWLGHSKDEKLFAEIQQLSYMMVFQKTQQSAHTKGRHGKSKFRSRASTSQAIQMSEHTCRNSSVQYSTQHNAKSFSFLMKVRNFGLALKADLISANPLQYINK